MLWSLMTNVSNKTHFSLGPMYSTVDPNLPTFYAKKINSTEGEEDTYVYKNGAYTRLQSKEKKDEESFTQATKIRVNALISSSGEKAKETRNSKMYTAPKIKKFSYPMSAHQ